MKTATIINNVIATPVKMPIKISSGIYRIYRCRLGSLALITLLLLSFFVSKTANAQILDLNLDLAPDFKASRSGYSAEIITGTHGTGVAFSARKSYYYGLRLLSVTYDNKVKLEEANNDNSYEYAYHSEFKHSAVIASIYPSGEGIFISSGVFDIDMQYGADGYVRRSFTENSQDYLLEAGYTTLVSYQGNTPYLGIGISTKRHATRRIGLRAELGVIFMPEPDNVRLNLGTIKAVKGASLTSDESLAAQAELREKAQGAYLAKVRRDAEDYNFFPVFEAGITYSF